MSQRKAVFSPDGMYRYTLWRDWTGLLDYGRTFKYVNFLCLNPSTATDDTDDNTIRKCIKFAKRWSYDGLAVTNIFALRSTDPAGLTQVPDPVGPENDRYIVEVASGADIVIAAWSQHGVLFDRNQTARQLLKLAGRPVYYLKKTTGEPHHPLYLKDTTEPTIWTNL